MYSLKNERKLKKKNREKDRNKQNGKMKQKNPVPKKLRKESTLMIELSNETKINAIEETIFRMLAQRIPLALSPGNHIKTT